MEVVPSSLETRGRGLRGAGGSTGGVAGYRDPGLRGDCLAWRGAAIIANVESSRDMWVKPEEWSLQGIALLRERLSFGPLL